MFSWGNVEFFVLSENEELEERELVEGEAEPPEDEAEAAAENGRELIVIIFAIGNEVWKWNRMVYE